MCPEAPLSKGNALAVWGTQESPLAVSASELEKSGLRLVAHVRVSDGVGPFWLGWRSAVCAEQEDEGEENRDAHVEPHVSMVSMSYERLMSEVRAAAASGLLPKQMTMSERIDWVYGWIAMRRPGMTREEVANIVLDKEREAADDAGYDNEKRDDDKRESAQERAG